MKTLNKSETPIFLSVVCSLFSKAIFFTFIILINIIRITKTCLFKYIENFTSKKLKNIQIKNSDIFHISAQNIDCGYSLEPPRQGGSNECSQSMFMSRNKKNNVYPVNPSFTI